jgi:hypothetical protein
MVGGFLFVVMPICPLRYLSLCRTSPTKAEEYLQTPPAIIDHAGQKKSPATRSLHWSLKIILLMYVKVPVGDVINSVVVIHSLEIKPALDYRRIVLLHI